MRTSVYCETLRRENVPALGCTEPMAVAYASALAVQALGEEAETLTLHVSGNILKNAMGVGLPGSSQVGLRAAAALAWAGGDPGYGLEVLRDIEDIHRRRAEEILRAGQVKVLLAPTSEKLYIRAVCKGKRQETSVTIQKQHTNVTEILKNGKPQPLCGTGEEEHRDLPEPSLNLQDAWAYSTEAPVSELLFLQAGIEMNWRIAQEGLKNDYGQRTGKLLYAQWKEGGGKDSTLYAAALTAAASDARMAGCCMPVMSVVGSGNQGIATILPPAALGRCLKIDKERVLRAVALCQLTAIHAKQYSGRLSALCGAANAAAAGIACAVVYLRGGTLQQAKNAVQNIAGDVAGMICDGAKSSCALKIATSVQAAFLCAELALAGNAVGKLDGIVAKEAEHTLQNLGRLAVEGMEITDQVILQMMIEKG